MRVRCLRVAAKGGQNADADCLALQVRVQSPIPRRGSTRKGDALGAMVGFTRRAARGTGERRLAESSCDMNASWGLASVGVKYEFGATLMPKSGVHLMNYAMPTVRDRSSIKTTMENLAWE
jgi:hypothetical protein